MNKKNSVKKFAIIFFVILAFISAFLAVESLSSKKSGEFFLVSMAGYSFSIPSKNILKNDASRWLHSLSGFDSSAREILVAFPVDEIARSIDGYKVRDGEYVEEIRALIAVMTNDESQRYQDPLALRDLWEASGSYQDRIIEEAGPGLYKVFRKVEYPYSWTLLSRRPENDEPIPRDLWDFWVAHCLDGGSSVTVSERHTTCKSRAIKNDLLIEFNVSEQNIGLIQEIKAFLVSEVASWQVQ